MKIKFSKMVSLLMSAVMTVSALSLSNLNAFADTDQYTEQAFESKGSEIQYDGPFGSMLSDEISESVKSNQEAASQDYVVYKIDHDPIVQKFGVEYHAKNECTLFVGIYNDEGTELITSVTKELSASEKDYVELHIFDALPDHYLIKAFIIGSELLNPVSKPCIYNKYTQQMQKILETTVENFEEDSEAGNVFELDENNKNNFLVLQDDIIKITSTDISDTYIEKDENGNFIFENAVKVAKLKNGDKVFVKAPIDMAAFIVDEIRTEENRVIISSKEAKLNEFVKFMKFNSEGCTFETSSEEQEKEDDGKLRANAPQQIAPYTEGDDQFALKFPTVKTEEKEPVSEEIYEEKTFGLDGFDNAVGLSATLKFITEGHVEIYHDSYSYDDDYSSISAEITASVEIKVGVSGDIAELPKMGVRYPILFTGFVNIYAHPKFTVSIQGEGTIIYARKIYLNGDKYFGIDYEITEPEIKDITGKITFELALDLSIELDITAITIFKISTRAGAEVVIDNGEPENPYLRHDCDNCCEITITFFIELKIIACIELWGIDELGIEYVIANPRLETKPLTMHINGSEAHLGPCPNKSYKIILHVYEAETDEQGKTKKGDPVKNASFDISTGNSYFSQFSDADGNSIKTDDSGRAEAWIKKEVLAGKKCVIRARNKKGATGLVDVGSNFNEKSSKPNSYTIILDSKEDIPTRYPKTGSCGFYLKNATAYVLDGSKGDIYDPETQSLIKVVNGEKVSIKVPPAVAEAFNGKTSCTKFLSLQHDNSVKYILDENGEIRVYGDGVINDVFFQEISHIEKISKIIIGPGVQTNYYVNVVGTNDKILRGLTLGNAHLIYTTKVDDEVLIKNEFSEKSKGGEVIFEGKNGDIIVDYFAKGNENITRVELSDFKKIGKSAFNGCINLSYITMPFTLETIDDYAFYNCQNLNIVNLYDGLKYIGEEAFCQSALQYADIPLSVSKIEAKAFSGTPLKQIVIHNPECSLGSDFVPESTVIFGYTDSSAHNYAKANGNKFVPLDPRPVDDKKQNDSNGSEDPKFTATTTTAVTTTVTTKSTTVVTTNVSPDLECIMLAVNDNINADSSADEILNSEKLRFFDQNTADENGVVTFSYVPNADESWSFMFVSQAIDNMIQKSFGAIDNLKTVTESVPVTDADDNDSSEASESTVVGDANGDGAVDMSDAVLIMQALANPNKYGVNGTDPRHITNNGLKYADADGDGFTVNDALRIQLYLLGKISSLA